MASFVPTEKPQTEYMFNITESGINGYNHRWRKHPDPKKYGDITYIGHDGKISYFITSETQLEDPFKLGQPTEDVDSFYIDRSTYNKKDDEVDEDDEVSNIIVPRQTFVKKNKPNTAFKSNLVVYSFNKAFDHVPPFINNSGITGINKISNNRKRFGKFLVSYGIEPINHEKKRHNNRRPTHIMYGLRMSHNVVGARDHGELFTAYTKPFNISKYFPGLFSRDFVAYCLPIVLALLMNLNPSNFSVNYIYYDETLSYPFYIVTEYDHNNAEKSETSDNDRVYNRDTFNAKIRELGDINLSNGKTITTDDLFSYFFIKINIAVRSVENVNITEIPTDFYNNFWIELNDYLEELNNQRQTPGGGKKYRKISKSKRKIQRSKRRKHRSQKKSNRSLKHRQ